MLTRLKLDFRPRIKIFKKTKIIYKISFWLFIICAPVIASAVDETLKDPLENEDGLIEVEYAPLPELSYKERRPDYSWLFGFQYRNYLPTGYQSDFDKLTYEQLFDNNILPVFGLRGGAKFGYGPLALTAEVSYATGAISSKFSGQSTSLQMNMIGAHIGLILDAIMNEPYVAPYVDLDVVTIDYEESFNGGSRTGGGNSILGWTAGLLVQLNWLEPEVSNKALVQNGLNNTFLDVFMAQSQESGGTQDLSSELNWGAGIKLEF